MNIDGSTMRVGGNKIKYWFGNKLLNIGNKITNRNKQRLVTNPSVKLSNPFTLIVSFTVDSTEKYQIVTQGDYKKIYKVAEDLIPEISENEMFMIIESSQSEWFKKE